MIYARSAHNKHGLLFTSLGDIVFKSNKVTQIQIV